MILRRYHPEDCQTLLFLFHETVQTVNAKDYSQAQLDAWTNTTLSPEEWNRRFCESFTLVAEENGVIVGFGNMESDGLLDMLYVHKNYQRQKIATKLCDRLEENTSEPVLTVHASVTAQPFFEQRGYTKVKEQTVVRHGIVLKNTVMQKTKIKENIRRSEAKNKS